MYRQYALSYEQRLFEAVHHAGGLARLRICGNTTRHVEWMAQSGADISDLDWMVDLRAAAATIGDRAASCGNFDPVGVMLQGTPRRVRQALHDCLAAGGRRNLSGAGCEIPDGTPHANLVAQAQALWEWNMR